MGTVVDASYQISLTEEKYTTITGIVLHKTRESDGNAYGPWEFFVNGCRVDYWTYERTEEEFYTENVEIGDSVTEIPTT